MRRLFAAATLAVLAAFLSPCDRARAQDGPTEAARREADARCEAGTALFGEQRYEEARREFEAALGLDPDHREARRYLERCRALLDITTSRALGYGPSGRRAQVRKALDEIELDIERARIYHREAEKGFAEFLRSGSAEARSCAARDVDTALEHCDHAAEMIKWLPGDLRNLEAVILRERESLALLKEKLREPAAADAPAPSAAAAGGPAPRSERLLTAVAFACVVLGLVLSTLGARLLVRRGKSGEDGKGMDEWTPETD